MSDILDDFYQDEIDSINTFKETTNSYLYEEYEEVYLNDIDEEIEKIESGKDSYFDDEVTDDLSQDVQEDKSVEEVVEQPKPRRGRKPKDRIYFGEEQEKAVKQYLTSTDMNERNRIYDEILAPAFKKMVEAIIRGRDLYMPNEEFIETYRDTLSHLLSKADKFDFSKGKRAYSYYSNICKNYLIGKHEKYEKTLIRNPSYDALGLDFDNNINYSTSNNDKGKKIAEEEVRLLTKRIKEMVDAPEENGLKESEIKIGKALINLFENWDYVLTTDNSNKLNKSVVLLFLREQTGLDTKGIRDNLKKFKKEFLIIKNFIVS